MAIIMEWEEIKNNFPDEWIAVAEYRRTGAIGVNGTVIAHNPDKKTFHKAVKNLMPQYHNIAVRYTGKLIKNPEIPLLWQILDTN
ncbi:MAG: hypothetical protein Q8P84_03925 [Deltaproteobacteria bacterium]|nr:hypothetical protein [Deltaproteobacteria bacterium]